MIGLSILYYHLFENLLYDYGTSKVKPKNSMVLEPSIVF